MNPRHRLFGEFWLQRRRRELKRSQSGTEHREEDSGAADLPPCCCLPTLLTISEGLCTLAGAQRSSTHGGLLSKESCSPNSGVLPKGPQPRSAAKGQRPGCGAALSTRRAGDETKTTTPTSVNKRIRKELARGSPDLEPPAASAGAIIRPGSTPTLALLTKRRVGRECWVAGH